jgi:3'-phosphoadenosine 5'-phosphosulfate (PAPS) 3'-phosphatase
MPPAKSAGAISAVRWTSNPRPTPRPSPSPTRQCERALRDLLVEARPDDAIIGGEFGTTVGTSGYTWVLDPIDGTKQFISGKPLFGILIACWQGDRPMLGQSITRPWANDGSVLAAIPPR